MSEEIEKYVCKTSVEAFSTKVEELVKAYEVNGEKQMGYLEACIMMATYMKIDIELIPELISDNIIEKIRKEGESLNLLSPSNTESLDDFIE